LINDVTVNVASAGNLIFSNALNLMGNAFTKTAGGDLAIGNDLITGGGTLNMLQESMSGNGTVTADVAILGGAISLGSSVPTYKQ